MRSSIRVDGNEAAVADALELKVHGVAADPDLSSPSFEKGHRDRVSALRESVAIPVAVKLGPYSRSFAHVAREIVPRGADGLELFERADSVKTLRSDSHLWLPRRPGRHPALAEDAASRETGAVGAATQYRSPVRLPHRVRLPRWSRTLSDVWHLRAVDWLQELSPAELRLLQRDSYRSDYARGATIFTPSTDPHHLFLLEGGLVRIYRLSSDGDETTFGYVAPGEVFGELTAFGDFPRESFAVAVHPSRVWKISVAQFQRMLEQRPSVVLQITRLIGHRMKRIESRVEKLVFRDVRARLAGILVELSEDFGVRRGETIALDIDLTQSELATLAGSTRQTINANLGELENAGLIERDGRRLVLLKPDELARVARTTSERR